MAWQSGAGFTFTHAGVNGGSAVDDPGNIDLGDQGIWYGIKQGLKYATALFGNTDKIQLVRIQIPGAMACVVATAGTALTTATLTNPAGSTSTALGKVVGVTGPNLQANSVDGNVKVISIQLGNNADGSPAVLTPN